MNAFDYRAPRTLDEALAVLGEHGEDARVIAGGTALVTMMRQRLVQPGLPGEPARRPGARRDRGGERRVRLGALVTHREAEISPLVRSGCPSSRRRSVVWRPCGFATWPRSAARSPTPIPTRIRP